MKTLVVYPEARQLGVHNPIACVIDNVRVFDSSGLLDDDIQQLMRSLAERFATVKNSLEFRGFAEMFLRMGYENQLPAGQRLVDGFLKRGFKKFNNIVDAYNIVSASNACGIGMHDADKASSVGQNVDIFCSTGTEKIVPMFKTASSTLCAGDLAYGYFGRESIPFAWLGKKDIDSEEYKVTDETTKLLLLVTGNSRTSEEFNRCICQSVFSLVRKTCQEAEITYLNTVKKCS